MTLKVEIFIEAERSGAFLLLYRGLKKHIPASKLQ